RSGLAWNRICLSWYFLPWPGARSGRALISQTCSSAAKPRPKRMSGGSAAWAAKAMNRPSSSAVRITGAPPSHVIGVELFPVYQPVAHEHDELVERIAEERDDHHD